MRFRSGRQESSTLRNKGKPTPSMAIRAFPAIIALIGTGIISLSGFTGHTRALSVSDANPPVTVLASIPTPQYNAPTGTISSAAVTVRATMAPYSAARASMDLTGVRGDGAPVSLSDIYCDISRGDRSDPGATDTLYCPASLSDGDYQATVKTWDQSGSMSSANGSFAVAVPFDYQGPAGTVTRSQTSVFATMERYVARKAALGISGIRKDGALVTLDDIYCEIIRGYPDSFSCPVSLSDGDYRATVKTWDQNGYLRTASGDFTVGVPLIYKEPIGIVSRSDLSINAEIEPFVAMKASLDLTGSNGENAQIAISGAHCEIIRGDRNDPAGTDVISCPVTLANGNFTATVRTWDQNGFQRIAGGSFTISQKPVLDVQAEDVYWYSYAEYSERALSVEAAIANNGPHDAYEVRITGSANSNGVTLIRPASDDLGGIDAGSEIPVILKYRLPSGVIAFRSQLTASARDGAGMLYSYP